MYAIIKMLERLERRAVITTNPEDADKCCGIERDDDGFCQHRNHHPIYVDLLTTNKPKPECSCYGLHGSNPYCEVH